MNIINEKLESNNKKIGYQQALVDILEMIYEETKIVTYEESKVLERIFDKVYKKFNDNE